jgi:uncharacterized protein (DUF1697 family)
MRRSYDATVTTYVVLLRGVNLGRNRRLAMADLRRWLDALGYDNVRTHLQSGNAVITTTRKPAEVGREIEKRLEEETGASIRCVVRTHDDLQRVVDGNPFEGIATDPARFLVAFLAEPAKKARLAKLDPAEYEPERWHIGQREIYLWHPNGINQSKLTNELNDRNLGVMATARNWNTVLKLLAMSAE